jgi:hypothetical protein
MSSLQQLVDMGILSSDFLKVDPQSVQIQSSDVNAREEQEPEAPSNGYGHGHGHGHGHGRGLGHGHGYGKPREKEDNSLEVVYFDREDYPGHRRNRQRHRDEDQDEALDPAPDQLALEPPDLAYYQTVGYHWLYSSPSYGWWHYAKEDNDKLESMYQTGNKKFQLNVEGNTFHIDYERMVQQGTGKPRNLLRTTTLKDIALKGVAGSRIQKRDILEQTVSRQHFTYV